MLSFKILIDLKKVNVLAVMAISMKLDEAGYKRINLNLPDALSECCIVIVNEIGQYKIVSNATFIGPECDIKLIFDEYEIKEISIEEFFKLSVDDLRLHDNFDDIKKPNDDIKKFIEDFFNKLDPELVNSLLTPIINNAIEEYDKWLKSR